MKGMDELTNIRKLFASGKVRWRQHALIRMMQRGISRQDVKLVVKLGEIVERYPSATPYPAFLVFGDADGKTLHVVVAYDDVGGMTYIVTVYEPDEKHFMPDFKTRKR